MNTYTTNYIAQYLNEKKVPFLIRMSDNKICGIKVTKEGKFFKANGKVISKQFASYLV